MAFAVIFVPEFMVQAVVRAEPALYGRAVALLEGTAPLWSVVAANEAALRTGIEIGMTKANAAQFSGVELRARSQAQEKNAHAMLLDLGWSVSPQIEDAAADTVVVNISGLNSLFKTEEAVAQKLMRGGAEGRLTLQVAVAANPETAMIAARGLPGITIVRPGDELQCVSALPVSVLLPSLETADTLRRWGIRTCGMLVALPLLELSERLGQEGVRLHSIARGANQRSLVVVAMANSFEEEMELDDSVEELEPLSFLLGRLLDQLCTRLTARALAASMIRVRFELEASFEKKTALSQEIIRQKNPSGTYEQELRLPVPMRDSKMLLKLLRLRLQAKPPDAPILKITLTAESARPRSIQGGLFLPAFPDIEKLELTIARIASVVGEENVGSPELIDTHRPDAFRMQRFAPHRETLEKKQKENNRTLFAVPKEIGRVIAACRIFRPAIAIQMELQEERPARVFLQGMRGKVLAASGPWRSSGDWWQEDEWAQEEWDLEIRFVNPTEWQRAANGFLPEWGLYRVYYDRMRDKWFVHGIYD